VHVLPVTPGREHNRGVSLEDRWNGRGDGPVNGRATGDPGDLGIRPEAPGPPVLHHTGHAVSLDNRPEGGAPRIWFRVEPAAKVVKNRLHLDIHASGSRSDPLATRKQRVDAEAKRLTDLGATLTVTMGEDGLDWYAVGMKDPEGNEFDIN
jgi:hypothetical protein